MDFNFFFGEKKKEEENFTNIFTNYRNLIKGGEGEVIYDNFVCHSKRKSYVLFDGWQNVLPPS